MKDILIDISGKLDNSYIAAIKEIKKIADSLKIPFFIIGALARDIIMEYFYEIKAPRMTMDIDLGISGLAKLFLRRNSYEDKSQNRAIFG